MSLAWACSIECSWLWFAPIDVPCSGLVMQRSLAWGCSIGNHSFVPAPVEASLARVCSHGGSLAQACSSRGPWFGPDTSKVSGSGLLLWWSLLCTCSCGGCCLRSAPVEVAGSGLLPRRSLAQSYSRRGPWLRPVPVKVPGLGLSPVRRGLWLGPVPLVVSPFYLFLQKSLARACSSGGSWIRPDNTEVPDSDLVPQRSNRGPWLRSLNFSSSILLYKSFPKHCFKHTLSIRYLILCHYCELRYFSRSDLFPTGDIFGNALLNSQICSKFSRYILDCFLIKFQF